MPELKLKYGCNPNQAEAALTQPAGEPLRIVNGRPSYINLLDALRGWQLVKELKAATGKPAAASFKHVSPAGAAVAGPLADDFRAAHLYGGDDLSPVASAYAKARSADRQASFGDFVAVSEPVDASLAGVLKPEVSDGIIAPAFDDEAKDILAAKKKGGYVMLTIDPAHEPPAVERRDYYGFELAQSHNDAVIDAALFDKRVTRQADLDDATVESLITTTVALKHTQSNSVAVGVSGIAVGIGAGQQSRIACTRLACEKFDRWRLKTHPKTLAVIARLPGRMPRSEKVNAIETYVRWAELDDREQAALANAVDGEVEPITAAERAEFLAAGSSSEGGGVVCSSDAFFPFRDNLDRAAASGVSAIAQAGGSARDEDLIAAADEHGMVMAMTGLRLFLH